MSSVKVSVIIPVRNQANFIIDCLESVMNQTLKEIEIIVVEGGSTDGSQLIIAEKAHCDTRITMLSKPGEGISLARQAGVSIAKGSYIHHLDGDDILEPQALELLYNRAEETNADIVVLNFWIENEFNQTRKQSCSECFVRFSGIDFIKSLYLRKNYWMVWSLFHRHDLYEKFEIKFEADLSLGEDTLLTTQLAYYSKKVVKLDSVPLLHHYIRKCPEEKRLSFSKKHYFDLQAFPDIIRKFLKEKPEYSLLEESVDHLRLQVITRGFEYHCFDSACEHSREALEILRRYPSLNKLTSQKMKHLFHAYSMSESIGKLVSKLIL